MKNLERSISQGRFLLNLKAQNLHDVFEAAVDHLVAHGHLAPEHRLKVIQALEDREAKASTAIGHSMAVPHAYLDEVPESMVFFVRLHHSLPLGAPDGFPTKFVFILLGPEGAAAEHLDLLAQLVRLMSDDVFRYEATVAPNRDELLGALRRAMQRAAGPKPKRPAPADDGLRPTGRWFGGMIEDFRRRWPHYVADFRDGLHTKSISSTLFLFFACLAPAITFGGLMATMTGNYIGAVEMLVASAFCGVVYALFSGQPLIILGGTGPLLIFTALLYQLLGHEQVQLQHYFLETLAWVGLWCMVILLVIAAADGSRLMRYFTRFTDETFAALISLIFIYEAVRKLLHQFQDLEEKKHHDTALLTLLLALGTLYVATSLSRIRRSRYLLPAVREFLADFGPTIAMAAMTLLAISPWLRDVALDVLPIPEFEGGITPTKILDDGQPRSWLVNPFRAPVWIWIVSFFPAALLAVLVFVDQNITARLVNNPQHKLTKGPAYHWDLALVAVLMGVCSLFGLPWLVAATVRSLNHVRSLATVEEAVLPSGEKRERIVHVRENRITPLAIHLLIALSLLLLPLLKLVPMAVLYGLFLYMGIVSMAGNQFFERLQLWLTDPALYPSTHYIRRVPQRVIHAFTAVQLACLAVLWAVKTSVLGILFPLFIALLVPVRLLLPRWFREDHLEALDAEEEPEEEEEHWV